jgi:glucose/arabinose dehydrogenase
MVIVVVSSGSIPVLGQPQQYYDGRHLMQISLDGGSPQLTDPNLRLEEVASGLENPTAMAFLGDSGDDIFVIERNNGNVKLVIIDGEIQDEPLIDVEVANNNGTNERGLLGMAVIDATDETAAAAANSTVTTATYYYAYGIRNSFGMDFDPVTGNLWDTENGPEFGDEINLVEPGFNSGWADVQRLMSKLEENLDEHNVVGVGDVEDVELIDFGRGNYSDPEFVWQIPVGVTSIKFFNSPNFGGQYQNDMFVGDINNGILYNFDLNENRTGLELDGALADKVANSNDDRSDIVFGTGFNGITDTEVGPDGYLYILSYGGTIYRIVSEAAATNN